MTISMCTIFIIQNKIICICIRICLNHVIFDPTNLSNNNLIELGIDNLQTPINLIDPLCTYPLKQSTHCKWIKATQTHARNYAANVDHVLQSIDISNDLFTYNNLCCMNATHVNAIDKLIACIVKYCIESGVQSIPHSLRESYLDGTII